LKNLLFVFLILGALLFCTNKTIFFFKCTAVYNCEKAIAKYREMD